MVKEIDVFTDATGVRTIKVGVVNGLANSSPTMTVYNFGSDLPQGSLVKSEFHNGRMLLGVFGYVQFDPENNYEERLLDVGFFRDDCSRERQLYFDSDFNGEIAAREWSSEKTQIEKHWLAGTVGILLIIYVIIATFLICYCGIKNRVKIIKAYKNAGGA